MFAFVSIAPNYEFIFSARINILNFLFIYWDGNKQGSSISSNGRALCLAEFAVKVIGSNPVLTTN